MGLLSHKVERNEIKPGDHIYTWRAVFTYSHNGIFVGGSKVVHFTRNGTGSISNEATSDYDPVDDSSSCPTFPDCGFRMPNSGVVLSCLDCFLKSGSLHLFEYGATPSAFLAKVRGGTCTIAQSDPSETNNCEDFAIYCKTGLLILEKSSVGRSGQAYSVLGAPIAALMSSPLKLLVPSPVGVATVTAGMYCMSRYATDIGVRSDVIKVEVEDLAANPGWEETTSEEEKYTADCLFSSFLLAGPISMANPKAKPAPWADLNRSTKRFTHQVVRFSATHIVLLHWRSDPWRQFPYEQSKVFLLLCLVQPIVGKSSLSFERDELSEKAYIQIENAQTRPPARAISHRTAPVWRIYDDTRAEQVWSRIHPPQD
ncbi:LEAD-SENSITIVE 1-like protein [Drosera capensis]